MTNEALTIKEFTQESSMTDPAVSTTGHGTILIVDDDVASCRTLQLHLRSQGNEVFIAHSVDEGLATASSNQPDLVILDIRMPGKSGLDGLPEFKKYSLASMSS